MSDTDRARRIAGITTLATLVLLAYSIVVVEHKPAVGFELSIYSATPAVFWIAVIAGVGNACFLMFLNVSGRIRGYRVLAIFQLILSNYALVSVYALRGYYAYLGRGDVSTYIGMAVDVGKSGQIPDTNVYPFISTLLATCHITSGVSVVSVANYAPGLLLAVFILGVYCWGRSLSKSTGFATCMVIAASPVFFAWYSTSVYHMFASVMMLPLLMAALSRIDRFPFMVICTIMIVGLPYLHPITAAFVAVYIAIMAILASEWKSVSSRARPRLVWSLWLLLVVLIGWFTSCYTLFRAAESLTLQLLGRSEVPTAFFESQYYIGKLGIAEFAQSVLLMIGDEIAFYGLSAIVLVALLSATIGKKLANDFERYLITMGSCAAAGTIFLVLVTLFARGHTMHRLANLNMNVVLLIPVMGILLYGLSGGKPMLSVFPRRPSRRKSIAAYGSIMVAILVAVVSVYPSPITEYPNGQISVAEMEGMYWLIMFKQVDEATLDVASPVYRFSDLLFGHEFTVERTDLKRVRILDDHFALNETNVFPTNERVYLVITQYDVESYTVLWIDIDRFSAADFRRLDWCVNMHRILDNGQIQNYHAYPGE